MSVPFGENHHDSGAWADQDGTVHGVQNDDSTKEKDSSKEKQAGPSQATRLVSLAELRYTLHCSTDGEPFALLKSGPPVARMLRRGRTSLRVELAAAYNRCYGAVPSAGALADALTVIEGRAADADPEILHLRVAQHGGVVYLDLGRTDGACVRVDASGWRPVTADEVPVIFRRTALTAALPEPTRGGDLAQLWNLLNVRPAYQPVVAAVLVGTLLPGIPHPILAITGEQGTAKTTASKLLSAALDPSAVQVRKAPRDAESWTTAAAGSWVVALDNLSTVPEWLSDAICRASTGEGDVRRRLYTDGELHVIAYRRQVIVNGIDLGALRGDFADRLVTLVLDLIPDEERWPEEELPKRWARVHPVALGALLDLTSRVLAELPTVRLDRYPRMADFARVLAAVDRVLGTKGLATYLGSRTELAADAVSADPVLTAITTTVTAEWVGTSAELLAAVTPRDDQGRAPKDWPTARQLTTTLRRDAPTLRRLGWTVEELRKDTYARALRFRLVPPEKRRPGSDARDARHARNEDVSAGQNLADEASDRRATAERSSDVARPPLDARTDARTATPPLTSPNGATSSVSSDASDEYTPTLSGCGCEPPCPDDGCLLDLETT